MEVVMQPVVIQEAIRDAILDAYSRVEAAS